MQLLATFHTHYGAMQCLQTVKKADSKATMRPVPRTLSASCGVCVVFEGEMGEILTALPDLDGIYAVEGKDYRPIYRAEE